MNMGSGAGGILCRRREGYSAAQRALHWAILFLCLLQVPTSWAIARTHIAHVLLKPDPFDLFLHDLHAWGGWLTLFFVIVQIALRYTHGAPTVSKESSWLVRWAAAASHATLYGLLIALPITGTAAMYLDFTYGPIHRLLSWALLAVVLAHTSAALWHHFYRRDDVLRRMIKRA